MSSGFCPETNFLLVPVSSVYLGVWSPFLGASLLSFRVSSGFVLRLVFPILVPVTHTVHLSICGLFFSFDGTVED